MFYFLMSLCSEDEVFRETFSKLVFEKLFCAKLQDVVQFLFGHGSSLGAQTRSHHQVSQHHLFLCHLKRKGHEMTFASAGVLFTFFQHSFHFCLGFKAQFHFSPE